MTSTTPDDAAWAQLLAAAQMGDSAAYGRLLREMTPFIRTIVRRSTWNEADVEDVVQDVLLTVHRIRHTYEPGRPVKPWLAAIVARRAIDALRKRGGVAAREVTNESAFETFADPSANKELTAGDAAADLGALMAGLTRGQRQALELVKLKEMSLIEASAASGQSVALLKVNVHRALKRLRAMLAKEQKP